MNKRVILVCALATCAVVAAGGFLLREHAPGVTVSNRAAPSPDSRGQAAPRAETLDGPRAKPKEKVLEFDRRIGAVTDVTDRDAARVKALLQEMTVHLSLEERDLLEKHPPEKLGDAISDAEVAYRNADDSNRADLEQRYLSLLNLAAKFAPPPAPTPAEEAERYRQYHQALEARSAQLARLPEKEAARLKESVKDEIFHRAAEGQ